MKCPIPRLGATMVIAAGLLLSACGGGGDDPPAAAQPQSVVATQGDGSRYLGTWTGECGTILLGTVLHAVQYSFTLTSASANTASGTLSVRDYGTNTISCNTQGTPSGPVAITLTVDTTPAVASGIVAGSADRVTISQAGAGDQVVHIAFRPDFARFWLNDTPSYASTDIAYDKFMP